VRDVQGAMVPSLSEWGAAGLALLLLAIGATPLRRRSVSRAG
jgi:hypothetical protein